MDCKGADEVVVGELGGAEKEGEEVVVVETPDAVGAGRFEIVCFLQAAHEGDVSGEYDEGERGEGCCFAGGGGRRCGEEGELVETQ